MASHEGIHNFTIGQSKGLGMDHHEKLFVIKIDSADNTVRVGDEHHLFAHEVDVVEPRLLGEVRDGEVMNVKIRYQHKGSPAQVFKTATGYKLKFQDPQRAVTQVRPPFSIAIKNLWEADGFTL